MVHKEFLLKLICIAAAVLRAVMIYLPLGWWHCVYLPNPLGMDSETFSHTAENYGIIIFFCIGIIFCNFRNEMKRMWMFSIGLLLSDAFIRRIEKLDIPTAPMDWRWVVDMKDGTEPIVVDVLECTYTPSPYVTLLPVCCWVIFILSFILYMWQKRDRERMARAREEAVRLEREAWEEKVNEKF